MIGQYRLNEEAFWFQDLTVSEEEQVALEIMLEDAGWEKAEYFGQDDVIESLIEKGLVWWTIINGTKWVVMKPMDKKTMKIVGKQLKKDMKARNIDYKSIRNQAKERSLNVRSGSGR